MEDKILRGLVFYVPLIISLGIHEWAHAFSAYKLGDNTARFLGRMTINPIRHMDIVGTVIFPMVALLMGGPFFGWAKPVPINPRNFANPLRDMALTAIAGPMSNFVLAVLFALLRRAMLPMAAPYHAIWTPLFQLSEAAIFINILLGVFNLIPIPPLDGSRVVRYFLPPDAGLVYDRIEQFGFVILIAILFMGGFRLIIAPVMGIFRFLTTVI